VTHVLTVRPDGMGDVLLAGPAVRAVAARASRVTVLTSPAGRAAASRLPGVDQVIAARLPWIDPEPEPVTRAAIDGVRAVVGACEVDEAVIFTSFHQTPLPTALVLRLAGVAHIGAISVDYPGSLLDVRHHVRDDVHEVERNLSLATAMGYEPLAGDDALRVTDRFAAPSDRSGGDYVAVHPGASVPARTLDPDRWRCIVAAIVDSGRRAVVTGSAGERALVENVAGGADPARVAPMVCDDFDALAGVLRHAQALVVGNTGPLHLAAAVGTPVVACHPPTVPAVRWHPWRVPYVLLGDQRITCAGCRARVCPRETQVCLEGIGPREVIDALGFLDREAGPLREVRAVAG
jgi:ADP-heptose:LPS heptosyltransferase